MTAVYVDDAGRVVGETLVVALDGMCLDVADTPENAEWFAIAAPATVMSSRRGWNR